MNYFCPLKQKILCICKCEYSYFFNKSNVVGVGFGYKTTNGFNTFYKCIKVFVTKKIANNEICEKDLIPSLYKGILTDVVESGNFTASSLNKKIRPVTGGYSISPAIGLSGGSMGCLVTDQKYYYVLSNNHIMVPDISNPLDIPIIQPAIEDNGHYPEDEIAILSKYIPLKIMTSKQGPENYVDCAIAKVTKRSQVSTKIAFLGRIKGVADIDVADNVQKVGRTTDLTKGSILTIGTTFISEFNKEKYLLKNQLVSTKMSQPGDSGSILLDDNINAVGLLVGESKGQTVFNPIIAVLNSLDVKIVTGSV